MRLPSATPKSGFRSALLGLALTCVSPSLLAEMRIAVVDSQRAVVETEDGLRMQATLKKIFDERQRELDQKQTELQKERAELEKQRTTMKPDVLAARAEKWQVEAQTVQQMFMEYNRELQRKQSELMQPILAQAMTVVQRIAKAEGFSMVVDKQAVPYVQPEFDLTDKVIKAYNEGGAASAAALPAAKPQSAAPAAVPQASKK
jgi:outer membrane protein